MPSLFLRPRARLFHGHDWVYGAEISHATGDPQPGGIVDLHDKRNRMLGSAIYNPASNIVARRFSYRKQELTPEFFLSRIQRAKAYREERGLTGPMCRLVWSESDGLPGVIVDQYGDWLVVQTLTLAMDQRYEMILDALREVFQPKGIMERNDASVRQAEGLEPIAQLSWGEAPPTDLRIEAEGLSWALDLSAGQKTGMYLDQLSNHALVARHAKGRRVLDAFCHHGGFALQAARQGATEVVGVDISGPALEIAKANADCAGLKIKWVEENAFDFLKAGDSAEESYDMIVLDPPSFTKNKQSVDGALRGYKEIHLRALKMLKPGGLLATFSCSHHVDASMLRQVVCDAAVDARKCFRQLETYGQRADHPVNPLVPETEYLRGFLFEVIASW